MAPAANMTPSQVRSTWERVCRDFDPFDVNITTQRSVYDAAPETSRIICIITANDAAAPGAGGVAYLESFEMEESSGMKICWAFIDDDSKSAAEVISHEIGHTLSLTHDGRLAFLGEAREEYFLGHGDGVTGWAPIMGAGYYKNVTQWSRGEYFRANNPEDDLAAIALRLTYLPATHGGEVGTATEVTNAVATGLIGEGNILSGTNGEAFVLRDLPVGMHTIEVFPEETGNLDAKLQILNSDGSTNRLVDPPALLGARAVFSTTNTNALYLRILSAGVGQPTNQNSLTGYKLGYSTYGSLGRYRLLYLRQLEFARPFSVTNPAGRYFSRAIFSPNYFNTVNKLTLSSQVVLSSNQTSTNPGTGIITTTTVRQRSTNVFSNEIYEITPSLVRTNGLTLNRLSGQLEGYPTTNFILDLSSDFSVAFTNRSWTRTTVNTMDYVTVVSNLGTVTNKFVRQVSSSNSNSAITLTPGGMFTNTNPMRLVFQSPAVVNFNETSMPAVGSLTLPETNDLGLRYEYEVVSGQGTLSEDDPYLLVSTSSLPALLRVRVFPDSPELEIWSPNSGIFRITKTNPPDPGFAFVTNTNTVPHSRTQLAFRETTPLVVTNFGFSRVTYASSPEGRIFFSNHPILTNLRIPYFEALTGTGTGTVTATLAATADRAATVATLEILLTLPTNRIVMQGFLTNLAFTNTNPALTRTNLQAQLTPFGGRVEFTSSDPAVARITNRSTLVMVGNGVCDIVASEPFPAISNYVGASSITNRLTVNWLPDKPTFSSTNRQDGRLGVPFGYTLIAGPNTNAFPITYHATNLAPGLAFVAPNKIIGTPTVAGLFRMQLTASNAGGVTTNTLTSALGPVSLFSVTNPWSYQVALGTGTNTEGFYTFPAGLPAGIGSLTNSSSGEPPVLVLTNANTNPTSGAWFAGNTEVAVVFSNSQTNFTSPVSLNVRPGLPTLSIRGTVKGSAQVPLALASTVTPNGISTIPGYPLTFRASNLPSGLVVHPTSGVISGKPFIALVSTSSVWVSNSAGVSATSPVVFDVQPVAGAPLQLSLAFTNGRGTYSASNLPPGLSLDRSSGFLAGTPQAVGAFQFAVTFVPAGTNQGFSTNRVLMILPPAPVPVLPNPRLTAIRGQPLHIQPWVTGVGWEWAGADPLTNPTVSPTFWTNRIGVGTGSGVLSVNSNGVIRAATNGAGLVLQTTRTNPNQLALLWKASLPSSWPWQATLRAKIPTNLSLSSAQNVRPFLGAFLAPTNLHLYGLAALKGEGGQASPESSHIDASSLPVAEVLNSLSTPLNRTEGQDIWLRVAYSTNDRALNFSYNTNVTQYASANFIPLGSATNVGWPVTNPLAAYRMYVGSSVSNLLISSQSVALSRFAVLPGGVGFLATTNPGILSNNLPPGLSCDPDHGTIYGVPTQNFTGTVYLYATNSQGTNFTSFILQVVP